MALSAIVGADAFGLLSVFQTGLFLSGGAKVMTSLIFLNLYKHQIDLHQKVQMDFYIILIQGKEFYLM